jgi:hypothetical protein
VGSKHIQRRICGREFVKEFVAVFSAGLLVVAVVAPTLAQQQAPKASEAPEVMPQPSKGPEAPDVRKKRKKTAPAVAPKASEGADVSKGAQKKAQ